jgi:hypothetical protein
VKFDFATPLSDTSLVETPSLLTGGGGEVRLRHVARRRARAPARRRAAHDRLR